MNMKHILLSLAAFAALVVIGCDSSHDDSDNNHTSDDTLKFSTGTVFTYERYQLDTSDASGNNPDVRLDATKEDITETVVATGIAYEGRTNCIIVQSVSGGQTDSVIYSQSSNGDLYRYNFGFDYLNSFPELVLFIGHKVNVKWTLVAKLGGKVGDSWTAVRDSIFLPSFGSYVYLQSVATTKDDTTLTVNGTALHCHHVQHVVTATANIGGAPVNGRDVVDTYIAPEIGATVWDYFRSATVSGAFNSKARGSTKILTKIN